MKSNPIAKENLEFNSRLLDLSMSEIIRFLNTFYLEESISCMKFFKFINEILENEPQIDTRVIKRISNEIFLYVRYHILSLGKDLDIRDFFKQRRGIQLTKEYLTGSYIINFRVVYKNKLFVSSMQYSDADVQCFSFNELVIKCFGTIVDGIIYTEIARIKKELEQKK